MITYNRSSAFLNLSLLFRVHGSAVYRSVIPGVASVLCLIWMRQQDANEHLQDPYAVGVLVASTTFLIVYRANYGYSRYWEAVSCIYHMTGKWLDATLHTACFHMQCDHYQHIQPPSFFDYPELNRWGLTRDRERYDNNSSSSEEEEEEEKLEEEDRLFHNSQQIKRKKRRRRSSRHSTTTNLDRSVDFDLDMATDHHSQNHSQNHSSILDRAVTKSIDAVPIQNPHVYAERAARLKHQQYYMDNNNSNNNIDIDNNNNNNEQPNNNNNQDNKKKPLMGPPRMDGNWGALFDDDRATFYSKQQHQQHHDNDPSYYYLPTSFHSCQGGRTPSLFLQELAHLASLLNAVALSTLRNDVEGTVSPLGVYQPGSPWPDVDPDHSSMDPGGPSRHLTAFWYFFGFGQSPSDRTRYNAARPLPVLGGVSDAEIHFLQMARGPLAKTQLCWYWLSEFMTREHLAGSTGAVGSPIISRLVQFMGDGMTCYNQARKIMFIPFPFHHAQLSVLFVLIVIPAVAFLMDQYCANNIIIGSILAFFSVACMSGIHEVARELENPFRNIPNELPLVTLQAQFNEALLTMYAGYHPDQFWDPHQHTHTHTHTTTTTTTLDDDDDDVADKSQPQPQPQPQDSPESSQTTPTTKNPPMATTTTTTTNTAASSSCHLSQEEQLKKLQSKMEEYGKELQRLRGIIENDQRIVGTNTSNSCSYH